MLLGNAHVGPHPTTSLPVPEQLSDSLSGSIGPNGPTVERGWGKATCRQAVAGG